MIHYHGTPCGGQREEAMRFMRGRHVLIPWGRREDLPTAAQVCQSFCVDNGAFTAWRQGTPINDWSGYYEFVEAWHRHPSFDWAIIPDVIDGTEEENDNLLNEWPSHLEGVPVWHFHESFERLERLCVWPRIALGSSGDYAIVGTQNWWTRANDAMKVVCDSDGRPRAKLHGLRMLSPKVFSKLPLASADSTNAVRNSSNLERFGTYASPNMSTRMAAIADRIEAHQSSPIWIKPKQARFTLEDDYTLNPKEVAMK